ncbi:MAG: MetQ/NlpA family ABC transporter substrate-binding protein [Solirubrobacteraceae bacterium]|nr:MetQ/NlpA family ABC transporter substrate-binding protein [Solirubrobacteraceae bacterium]
MPVPVARPRLPLLSFLLALGLLVAGLALASCGDSGDGGAKLSSEPLRVGVSPVPHGEILRYVQDELAPQAGLNLDIREYTDYVLPNADLEKGELDANYFQVPAYLKETAKKDGAALVAVAEVHIEPLGLYSKKVKSIADIRVGSTVVLPAGAVTVSRSLKLLTTAGLITLRDPSAPTVTLKDIATNPEKLVFSTEEASRTPRALDDHDLAVINGNYALEAGLKPAEDAIELELVAGNPNVNLLATLKPEAKDPRIVKLAELLRSAQVRRFIDETYEGAVVPAP